MEPLCNCRAHKEGNIPVFLTRTSVGLSEHKLPALPSNFSTVKTLSGKVAYTSRILRSGYLYVYDEVKGKWLDYYITTQGFYYKLPPGIDNVEDALNNSNFSCLHNSDAAAMSCYISLKAYKEGKYHLIWSPVKWSEQVREQFNNSSFRKTHMHCFDVGQWCANIKLKGEKSSLDKDGVNLSQLNKVVAEYNANAQTHKNQLTNYSLTNWVWRDNYFSQSILKSANRLYNKGGLIFNIDDPIGLASDIAITLDRATIDYTVNNPDAMFRRKLFLKETFEGIISSAKYEAVIAAQRKIDQWVFTNMPGYPGYSDVMVESTRLTLHQIDEIQNSASLRYERRIDQSKKAAFCQGELTRVLTELNENILKPLAELHVFLMKSNKFKSQFDIHALPDNSDMITQNGILFSFLFLESIQNTQNIPLCAQLYQEWLTNEDPLLFRMLAGNNVVLEARLRSAVQSKESVSVFNEDFIELLDKMIEKDYLPLISTFLNSFSQSITQSLLSSTQKNAPINRFIKTIMAMFKKQIVPVKVKVSGKQFVHVMTKQIEEELAQANHSKVNSKQLAKSLRRQLEFFNLKAIAQGQTEAERTMIVMLDLNMTNAHQIASVYNYETFFELTKLSTKSVISGGLQLFGMILHFSNVYNYYKAKDENFVQSFRFYISIIAAAIATSDLGIKVFSRVLIKRFGKDTIIKVLGALRIAGAIAGIFMAFSDFGDAWMYFGVNNSIAYLLCTSSVLGFISAIWTLLSPNVYVIVIDVILFILAIYLEDFINDLKPNDLEYWILGTLWRVEQPDDIPEQVKKSKITVYNSQAQEQEALEQLLESQ